MVLDFALCLLMFAATVAAGGLLVEAWALGVALGVAGYALFAGCVLGLAAIRHRRLIVRLAQSEGLRLVAVRRTRGFVHPPDLPWWRGWAAYELVAAHPGDEANRYHVFLTGVLFCLFGVSVAVSTDEGSEWTSGQPQEVREGDDGTR